MKEKVIYIAEDGKEFENRAVCIVYELQYKNMTNIFKYISFYYCTKEKIIIDSELKTAFIQRYCTEGIKNSKNYNIVRDFVDVLYYIHISKDIPVELEKDAKTFLFNLCNDILDITRFDFEKGITYYYVQDSEIFTNTEYEKEKIQSQIKFLTELENFE